MKVRTIITIVKKVYGGYEITYGKPRGLSSGRGR
jgi:hypothetical protein